MAQTQKIDNPHISAILRNAYGGGVCGRDRDALIAAASAFSDMLGTLEQTLKTIGEYLDEEAEEHWDGNDEGWCAVCDAIQAAIAKAETK